MRVAIVTSVYYPQTNGVAVFSHNLALGLARRGNEVLVITPRQGDTGQVSDSGSDGVSVQVSDKTSVEVAYLKSKKVYLYPDQIHPVPKKKIFYKNSLRASIKPGRQMKKILDEFKPEVIHVQGSDPAGVFACKYAKKHQIPLVMTEHNQPEVLTESLPILPFLRKPVNRGLSRYFKKRLSRADFVTMPTSASIANLYGSSTAGGTVLAVSNGVDLSAFRPGKPDDIIYNIYGVPSDVPIVMYVGRVDPEKKIGVVLAAFAKFLDKHKLDSLSKTLFLVVGDGVDKERLAKLAQNLKIRQSVKFLGKVMPPELYQVYRMGDVFVTASEIETQGIVLIEAAASGLPLIAVDAGAVKEVCQDGVNGYLVKPGDESAMAEAMDKILSDKKVSGQMSKKSVEIARRHDLEKTIDKFVEIYQKVCYNGLSS